jgi:hypothetical protein
MDLRDAWTTVVEPDDLDRHMASNGQAAVNAELVLQMLDEMRLDSDSRILMPGAGTGQILDYVPVPRFEPFRWVFTDISHRFLDVLRDRLSRNATLRVDARHDDGVNPQVAGPFDAIVAVLVLEHLDWRAAIANWAALGPRFIGLVIQRNDTSAAMLAPRPGLAPSIERFRQVAQPQLVPEADLTAELGRAGFTQQWRLAHAVPDSKTMVALLYKKFTT